MGCSVVLKLFGALQEDWPSVAQQLANYENTIMIMQHLKVLRGTVLPELLGQAVVHGSSGPRRGQHYFLRIEGPIMEDLARAIDLYESDFLAAKAADA